MEGIRKNGDKGMIVLPISDGALVNNYSLVMVASKEIQGKTYTNRFYGHPTLKHWNKTKTCNVRLAGIIGEANVVPGTGNDKINIQALISYYKDVDSAVQTIAVSTDLSVTRPATNVAKWNLLVIDTLTGLLKVVAGTDATDTTFLNTFGSSAGQIPLVGVDELIVGAVKLTSSTAAVVASSEITLVDGNGRLLQERSDVPSFEKNLLEGGVLFSEALLPAHTGGVSRKVFATFYSLTNFLAPIAHSTGWKLNLSRTATEMKAQGDTGSQVDMGASASFTGSFSRYRVDKEMFKLAAYKGFGFAKLYPDRDDAIYYECAIILTNWGEGSEIGAAMKSDLQFSVDGGVEVRG